MNINKKYLDTKKYLRHVTDVKPSIMGDYIIPHYNHDAFGKNSDNYVFATDYGTYSKALYFLKSMGVYLLTEDEKSSIAIIKTYNNYLASFNKDIFMYFLLKDSFYKTISGNGVFIGEYVSKNRVPIIPDAVLTMNINDVLYDDELGIAPNIYVCEDIAYYKDLRKKLDLINSYYKKIEYLEELKYHYDDITGKIKVLE